MKWQRKPPDSVGYWLRLNAGRRVQLYKVWDQPGMGLVLIWTEADAGKILQLDHHKLKGWLWCGPLPEPPDEEPYKPEEGDDDGDGDA